MFRGNGRLLALVVLVSGLLVPALRADDEKAEKDKAHKEVAASVEKVLGQYCEAMGKGDLKALLETVHPSLRENTEAALQPIFAVYKLTAEVLKFKLLAVDGDVAVCRAEVRTRGSGAQPFADNDLESIQVYRREKGRWYNAGETILEIKAIEKEAEKPKAKPGDEDF